MRMASKREKFCSISDSTRASSTGFVGLRGGRSIQTSEHVSPGASTPVMSDFVPTSTLVSSAFHLAVMTGIASPSHCE